ncbi:F-type H+-transporting ATPase subunit delta [Clostridium tetanomorphum]|uniref:ATP synthase subunit delta n=1 Tax=Clostridium tetanomorphum TaxID=1553 RepID=A0A923EEE4_CLOTT|nr:F0F1 ATP synthase subunit delta [Clostridium tetanomorphum]KAJ48772.1 F0F1 ATP synthase subunit delta [Clostridium tetanomorphum DSM 665]KAJ53258.1 F0F1 ATP synthase subunit delta [Clostridium tetanomorphum DSM 665]MBC2399378.1 F0F1 ATP synthase subunit delta [Clostridium tetanomorphum]MBP1865710.1 F-type H+-transporting ATPase subunit delta [Clostridium tetanomorphum]NRS86830.1 F-type H+-transporting ATPase subunit delta [Clostridium tetanomorphum]
MYEYLDRRYAMALYEVAEKKNKIEEYRKSFQEIIDLVYSNPELIQLIKHPQISTDKKKKVFIKIFKGKIDEELLSFLLILIEKGRILYLKEKQKELEKIYFEKHNMLLAHIKTVIPLEEQDRINLKEKLKNKYKKEIILREEIDKSIIGGVYVRVGEDVIDGTIKGRLHEMKKLAFKIE